MWLIKGLFKIILLEEDIEVKLSEANPTTQATDYNSREQEDILTRVGTNFVTNNFFTSLELNFQ